MSTQNFNPNIVRSDQGGSRNLFLDYENKLSNVTLVFVDDRHFCAHKGSKIQNQYFTTTHKTRKVNTRQAIIDEIVKRIYDFVLLLLIFFHSCAFDKNY